MLGQNEIQEATVVSDGYSGQFGGCGRNQRQLSDKIRKQRFSRECAVLLERQRAECQRLD